LSDLKSMTQSFFSNNLTEDRESGRDYKSQYFRPNLVKGRIESPRSEDQVRARATVRFVGNERPYTILTWVEVETREKDAWESKGNDLKLARRLSDLLRDYIRTRRDKNLIDHFKSF
jgi:hypothetical protein